MLDSSINGAFLDTSERLYRQRVRGVPIENSGNYSNNPWSQWTLL